MSATRAFIAGELEMVEIERPPTVSDATEVVTIRRPLTAADIFSMTIPRAPAISPDGQSVLYLRETPEIATDQLVRRLHVVDRECSEDRAIDTGGSVLFAVWADSESIIVVTLDDAFDGGAIVKRLRSSDGSVGSRWRVQSIPSQVELSHDGRHLAMSMPVPWPRRVAELPAKPDQANWAPRAKYIDRAVWRLDGIGELDGCDQIFSLDLQTSELEALTDVLDAAMYFSGGIAWSKDDSRIFFASNIKPDWAHQQFDSGLYSVDRNSREIVQLTSRFGPDFDPKLSPDGDWIAYRGFDDDGRFHSIISLYVMRDDGSEPRVVADVGQDIASHAWDPDGTGLYISYVRDGTQRLARVSLAGELVELAEGMLPTGNLDVEPYLTGASDFSVGDNGVAILVATEQDPGQLRFLNREGRSTTLTNLNHDWLPRRTLGTMGRIDVKAADGVWTQAWLLCPPGYDASVPWPMIVNLHGGPDLAYGSHFSFRFQRYAAEGYIVLTPNYRGSLGGDMGIYDDPWIFPGGEFDDIMASVDAAIAQVSVDPARIFVTGLSAGGTLTAWTVGKTARFAAAAVHSPIINWLGYAMSHDLHSSYVEREFGKMPWEDPMAFWRTSPLSLVDRITTPTLVIHGEQDSRTPPSEGYQLFHALKRLRVPTAMVLLPEAFHIPTRPTQWLEEQQFIIDWFSEHSPGTNPTSAKRAKN